MNEWTIEWTNERNQGLKAGKAEQINEQTHGQMDEQTTKKQTNERMSQYIEWAKWMEWTKRMKLMKRAKRMKQIETKWNETSRNETNTHEINETDEGENKIKCMQRMQLNQWHTTLELRQEKRMNDMNETNDMNGKKMQPTNPNESRNSLF